MTAYRVIDKKTWPRAQLFDAFLGFANPCFNVSVFVEANRLFSYAKDTRQSVFLLALYAILRATQRVPQMRQRIVNGEVIEFERLAAMTPIMTEQELFQQIWCEYVPTFAVFAHDSAPKVETARKGESNFMEADEENYICASCVPWMHFTAVSSVEYVFGQSIPILTWGKLQGGLIPFSCKVHHGLIDGLHISRFFASIEDSFAHPDSLQQPLL